MPTRPARARAAGGSARVRRVDAEFGPRIRARREQDGISLRELARRLGISPSAISQIETGKSRPSVSTLYAIVNELGMSLDELFSGKHRQEAAGEPERKLGAEGRASQRHVQRASARTA